MLENTDYSMPDDEYDIEEIEEDNPNFGKDINRTFNPDPKTETLEDAIKTHQPWR